MTRTKKGTGGIWDIVTRKAKWSIKRKTHRRNGGIRQRHKASPVLHELEKFEGRACSTWEI